MEQGWNFFSLTTATAAATATATATATVTATATAGSTKAYRGEPKTCSG